MNADHEDRSSKNKLITSGISLLVLAKEILNQPDVATIVSEYHERCKGAKAFKNGEVYDKRAAIKNLFVEVVTQNIIPNLRALGLNDEFLIDKEVLSRDLALKFEEALVREERELLLTSAGIFLYTSAKALMSQSRVSEYAGKAERLDAEWSIQEGLAVGGQPLFIYVKNLISNGQDLNNLTPGKLIISSGIDEIFKKDPR